jgi:hypothetical protein
VTTLNPVLTNGDDLYLLANDAPNMLMVMAKYTFADVNGAALSPTKEGITFYLF